MGKPFSYRIVATNAPSRFFASSPGARGIVPPASSLPAGLTVDSITGLLTGAPAQAGSYTLQIAALNAGGIGVKQLLLTVRACSATP